MFLKLRLQLMTVHSPLTKLMKCGLRLMTLPQNHLLHLLCQVKLELVQTQKTLLVIQLVGEFVHHSCLESASMASLAGLEEIAQTGTPRGVHSI